MSKDSVPRSGPPRKSASQGSNTRAARPRPGALPSATPQGRPYLAPEQAYARTDRDAFAAAADDPNPVLGVAGLPATVRTLSPEEAARAVRNRRRLLVRLGLILMVVLLVLEVYFLSPFTDAVAGDLPRTPNTIPLTEVQPYGVNTFLHKEVDTWKKEKTLEMARDMGAGWIKQQFPWAEIEYRTDPAWTVDPSRKYWDVKNNQSAWDKFDGIVDLAQRYGLRIVARIDSAPAWAHPTTPDLVKAPPDLDHLPDFGNFIYDFVKRYQGRVAAIQVWNEPNLKDEWPTGVNADDYVRLLEVAYKAAKGADPNIVVLAAPLATTNETLAFRGNLRETDFLQAMYNAGARQYFDAMSANAYGTSFPPEDPPSADRLNFRRVELLHDVMVKNGDDNKAVWFNEYGWNDSPESMAAEKLRWGRVSPQQQADYTVRGVRYAREHWPWAGVFTIWYLRQVGDISPSDSEYYFGLVNLDFVPNATYSAAQSAIRSSGGVATPGEWGPLSAPVQAGSQWSVGLSLSVPGAAYLLPTALGNTLSIPFEGTGVRVKLVPPASTIPISNTTPVATHYYVTVDGGSNGLAPELPRDSNGRAYIDTSASLQQGGVTLVRGIGANFRTGQHVLRITVGKDPSQANLTRQPGQSYAPLAQRVVLPGIGSITVEARRSYTLFGILTLVLLAGIAFISWALWKSRPGAFAATRRR